MRLCSAAAAVCSLAVLFAAACSHPSRSAQPAPPPVHLGPDIPPLASTPGLSSGFGEFRGAHFHAGLDYSTDEAEGRPVRAVNDGWVERVRASGVGYGRAVYLHLLDGRTAVYGHLSGFAPKLDAYVAARQDSAGEYEQDLSPREGEIAFKQGEVVAWTGQSGAGPPHLHFEMRRGDTNFNPLLRGYALPDHIAPTLAAAWITPHGAGARVDGGFAPVRVALPAGGAVARAVEVRGAFDLAVNTWDRADGKPNKLATYRLEARLDSAAAPVFLAVIDSFSWDTTVEVERVYDYAATLAGDDDRRTLAWLPTYREHVVRQGPAAWRLAPGPHRIEITATDEAGDHTSAVLAITAMDSSAAESPVARLAARAHLPRGKSRAGGGVAVRLAGTTLYLTTSAGAPAPADEAPGIPAMDSLRTGKSITRVFDLSRLSPTGWTVIEDVIAGGQSTHRSGVGPGRGGWLTLGDRPDTVRVRVGNRPSTELELTVPPHSFFESTGLRMRALDTPPTVGELEPRSGAVAVEPADVVLAHSLDVAFGYGDHAPADSERNLGLFVRQERAWEFIGRVAERGLFRGSTRRLGTFAVFADTRPPVIGLRATTVRWRRGTSHARLQTPPATLDSTLAARLDSLPPTFSVRVRDGGSGLAPKDQSIFVDDKRVPAEYDPESGRLTWYPRAWLTPGTHSVRVEAQDRCGNRASRTFALDVD